MSDDFESSNAQRCLQPILQEQPVLRYSIDVLCNGTEYTSTGTGSSPTAAIFLSMWKVTNACQDDKEDEAKKLVARYGLDGVGSCDGLARIAADQQFKLGPVRALFLNHSSDKEQYHECLSSIPSLLYANQLATMSIVVPNSAVEDSLDKLVHLVHGHQTYPHVGICTVPTISSSSPPICCLQWWKVYEDDQIFMHAGRWDPSFDPEEQVLYLFTFRRLLATDSTTDSTLLCPSLTAFHRTRSLSTLLWKLPMIEAEGAEPRLPKLGITWVLGPFDKNLSEDNDSESSSLPHRNLVTAAIFLASPLRKAEFTIDPGLLVRAQEQTHDWRQHCDPDLLPYFPYLPQVDVNGNDVTLEISHGLLPNHCLEHGRIVLQTGTSIEVDILRLNARDCNASDHHHSVRILDRNQRRMHRQRVLKNHTEVSAASSSNRQAWPNLLRDFLLPATSRAADHDENEIDLDYFERCDFPSNQPDNGLEGILPHLLVLGTGCASPSPYRGASGYALLLPTHPVNDPPAAVAIAVEVGESYCTQWHRYGGGRSFAMIQVIWISHAHWDHYGGLINLILRIYQARHDSSNQDNSTVTNEHLLKKQKTNDGHCRRDQSRPKQVEPPIVMAPAKVLKYLNLLFVKPDAYYRTVHLEDVAMMKTSLASLAINCRNPILHWKNVRVDHSCLAFGFVLVLQFKKDTTPYIFCYSGDTRPCRGFVEHCRAAAKLYKTDGRVDFLLHEATFDESESRMCISKKHSTTKEAIMVARDMDAERLLLTHFSQRYDTIPDISSESEHLSHRMVVGFALDGMKVFL